MSDSRKKIWGLVVRALNVFGTIDTIRSLPTTWGWIVSIASAVIPVAVVIWAWLQEMPPLLLVVLALFLFVLAMVAVAELPGVMRALQSLWTKGEAHSTELDVVLSSENGPGLAQVRVENLGKSSAFTATATVLDVRESVNNPKFKQTFQLRWQSTGEPRIVIASGSRGVLTVASSNRLRESRGKTRGLCELLLEGYAEGESMIVDRFRWHEGDPHGAVTVELEVLVSTKDASSSKLFTLKSLQYGGVWIEETTPPADPPPPTPGS